MALINYPKTPKHTVWVLLFGNSWTELGSINHVDSKVSGFMLSFCVAELQRPCAIYCLYFYPIIWSGDKAAFLLPKQSYSCFTTLFLLLWEERVNRTESRQEWSFIFLYVCLLNALGCPQVLWLGLHAAYSVWAAGKAWGYWAVRTDAPYCEDALQSSWHVPSLFCLFQLPFWETLLWTRRTCECLKWRE